ncbi:L,D-transpeptidase family protein [Erythrobacteraceae bacterium E2-1 Yellow Sea]|nr:L,D-transpeptidase family protein [Erythrobacteraceae bacterium E2-1 Yellow Sea]
MIFSRVTRGLLASSLVLSGAIGAHATAPENLLPGEKPAATNAAPVAPVTAPVKPKATLPAETGFDSAFPKMVSDPVVQGDLTVQAAPLVQPWSIANARELVRIISAIGAEGLDPKDYDLQPLKTAIASGPSEELDQLASRSFAWLVEDLRDGRTPMSARKQWFVVDHDHSMIRTGDLLGAALESGDLAGILSSLSPTHPDYARLKAELAATPADQKEKRKLIRANMDRWRWLERDLGSQYLITNVPEFQLRLTVKDKIISTYRTIVGKPGRTATPQLAETVEGVIFNPTWTVPQSIVKGEGLGAKVLNNPAWAKSAGYTATKGANGWVTVVQQPGPTNSLGRMKLDMPNPHAIFLHDTPSRHLFANDDRALSHGCIRTERALELAITMAILGQGATKEEAVEIATSGKYTRVPIEKRLPVYITYFTMATDINGELKTFNDLYDRDTPVLASLDQPRVANRGIKTDEEIIVIEDDLRT